MATQLSRQILLAAIDGFEEHKRKLDEQIREVRALLSNGSHGAPSKRSAAPGESVTRRKMSAAGRRAIAAAQRKRWAAAKGATKTAAPKAGKKPKRKLSAAGRAAIVAALRKRWAAKKAGS